MSSKKSSSLLVPFRDNIFFFRYTRSCKISKRDLFVWEKMKNHVKKETCQVCKKEFSMRSLFPSDLVRPSLIDHIKQNGCPDWSSVGYICHEDLRKFRNEHVEDILEKNRGEVSALEEKVLQSLQEHQILTSDVNKKFERELTFGEKISDRVAKFGGSWTFIFLFMALLIGWMIFNSIQLWLHPFDPFPFIFLNLFLSCLAAVQAPIILMSQKRQAEKDQLRNEDDYCVNLKTELEMQHLHAKLDFFMQKQWDRLLEIQKIQLELAEEILEKKVVKDINKKSP